MSAGSEGLGGPTLGRDPLDVPGQADPLHARDDERRDVQLAAVHAVPLEELSVHTGSLEDIFLGLVGTEGAREGNNHV